MREIKDLHQPFIAYLQRWAIPYIYHRPDRRSGINKGHPDFTVLWQGKALLIEFKVPTGKLSLDQIKRQELLSCSGTHTLTLDSLENAIGYLEAWMGEKRFPEPPAHADMPGPQCGVPIDCPRFGLCWPLVCPPRLPPFIAPRTLPALDFFRLAIS